MESRISVVDSQVLIVEALLKGHSEKKHGGDVGWRGRPAGGTITSIGTHMRLVAEASRATFDTALGALPPELNSHRLEHRTAQNGHRKPGLF